jgi:hypothetical protein
MKRLIIPVIFIACSSHAAGIQKWVDEDGQIHYGDSPPAKSKTEQVRISRPPSNPGKALPRLGDTQKENKDEPETGGEQPASASAPQSTEEEAKQFCDQAHKDLETLNRNSQVRLRLNDGTTRYMTQEERDQRRKQSEQDIERYCK